MSDVSGEPGGGYEIGEGGGQKARPAVPLLR